MRMKAIRAIVSYTDCLKLDAHIALTVYTKEASIFQTVQMEINCELHVTEFSG